MYMFKYVLKRIGLMLMTFAVIMTVCFVLIKLLPIEVSGGQGVDVELSYKKLQDMGQIRSYWKNANGVWEYERMPIIVQFWNYLKNIFVNGSFGIGMTIAEYQNHEVWEVFTEKLPPTILINIYSSVFGVPIGIGVGIFAALKKNKWQDHIINVVIILLIALPSIVSALLIQYIFGYKLNWFPIVMETGRDYFSWSMFRSMLPAVFSLSVGSIAGYARITRAELSEVLTNEFMLLARTKGLTRQQATFRHALRNSMVVIFPSILAEFISILGGSLLIEQMFAIPGVGRLYLAAINYKDYDFFMFLSGFYTLVGLAATIVTDISYSFIDPRIKMGAR